MTIKELIEALSIYDQDTEVVVNGYEGGYASISEGSIVSKTLIRNYHSSSYMGPHEDHDYFLEETTGVPTFRAILISRSRS